MYEDNRKTLKLTRSTHGDVLVLAIDGRLTIGRVDEVDVFFKDALDQAEDKYVLDLSEMTHIVSSGIGVLIAFRERVMNSQGTLAVGGLNKRVLNIFRLMSLDSFFTIYTTVDEAVQGLGK